MKDLLPVAERAGGLLKARGETVAVAESSSGGLLSAALLAVPGASAYFLGGGVVYTAKARVLLMDLPREAVNGMRSASEPYALLLAKTARARFGSTWALSETGAAGPTGNPYGDAAGHSCIAIAGPGLERAITLETGSADRVENMYAFTRAALDLLLAEIDKK
ncbi:MAG TPA: CinA family protein [Rhizomicrobium sp.]|nr:CinA family protein [Rhizomicrobium sp.]